MNYPCCLEISTLSQLFGFDIELLIDDDLKNSIAQLRYRELSIEEESRTIKNLETYLDIDKQIIASDERVARWDRGWEYNLREFEKTGKYDALQPQYYRAKEKFAEVVGLKKGEFIYRLRKKFIVTPNADFEEIFAEVVRRVVLRRYFFTSKHSKQVEFGCGSCLNILRMAKDSPSTPIYALDFVNPPLEIARAIGKIEGVEVNTILQDMRNMNEFAEDFSDARIFTFGALEQLGGATGAQPWLNWALTQKGSSFLFIEPCIETYDLNSLVDITAVAFHLKRRYSWGIIPFLKQMYIEKKIQGLEIFRIEFGSLFIEGYTVIRFKT